MSKIQWTDETWNPIVGCSRVSRGCERCYAERMAHRLGANPATPAYQGLTRSTEKGPRWTGEVRLVESKLREPLRWRKPRRVFVNSMGDLFHEAISDEDVAKVFRVMRAARRHVFQILTKRPERMRAVVSRVAATWADWPWSHVWLGVSVEDQETADERIPILLRTQAAVRFVSAEPLLGAVDLSDFFDCGYESCGPQGWVSGPSVDWVIVGGESGPGARPCDVEWIRSVVEQCRAAQVPVFVKQLGARCGASERDLIAARFVRAPRMTMGLPGDHTLWFDDRKGGDPDQWPAALRVRDFPEVA